MDMNEEILKKLEQKVGRRSFLRGSGLAAIAIVGVAASPLMAYAQQQTQDEKKKTEDEKKAEEDKAAEKKGEANNGAGEGEVPAADRDLPANQRDHPITALRNCRRPAAGGASAAMSSAAVRGAWL